MNGAEAKKLSKDEIAVEIKRTREKLFQLRNQATTEKVDDTSQFPKLRQDLARLLGERAKRGAAPAKKHAPAAEKPKSVKHTAKKKAAPAKK